MKGIVFTEFLEFVATCAGEDMVDDIIEQSDLASGGIYTTVGTYDHREMITLLDAFCARTGMEQKTALVSFGRCLAGRFAVLYPDFFRERTTLFDFLESVDGHIHVEVRKLYPDAQLPRFTTFRDEAGRLVMQYRSDRHFDLLAEGLILGAAHHYGQSVGIVRGVRTGDTGRFTEFTIAIDGSAEVAA